MKNNKTKNIKLEKSNTPNKLSPWKKETIDIKRRKNDPRIIIKFSKTNLRMTSRSTFAGNPLAIISQINNLTRLPLLSEITIIYRYSFGLSGHLSTSANRIKTLADPEKMRAAGDRMPDQETFTLYRGVAGNGPARRKNGVSWTDSVEVEAFFAMRFNHNDPAVFMVVGGSFNYFTMKGFKKAAIKFFSIDEDTELFMEG